MRKYVRWARVNLGFWIIGRDFGAAIYLLMLTRDRARDCITPDGEVILAKCAPLADLLYRQVPGGWDFSLTPYPSRAPSSDTGEQ